MSLHQVVKRGLPMVPWRILLIDETDELCKACNAFLKGKSHPIGISEPSASARPFDADTIVFAPRGTHVNPCEPLKKLRKMFPSASYVLAMNDLTSECILTALRAGYTDIVTLPVDPLKLYATICRLALTHRRNGTPSFAASHVKNIADLDELLLQKRKPAHDTPLPQKISAAKHAVQNFMHNIHLPQRVHFPHSGRTLDLPRTGGFRKTVQGIHDATVASQADLQVYFFGNFRVAINNQHVDKWCSHKAKLLFAYMLLNRRHLVPRDVLMDRFWPSTQASSARDSLNVTIHTIRQKLAEAGGQHSYLLFKDECYCINPEVLIWVDVEEFMKHRQRSYRGDARMNLPVVIQELEAARKLYTADFMEEDLYNDWVSMERENLREMYLDTLDRLSDCYVLTNNTPVASVLCEKILEKDNCREDIHRRLMACYYRLGSRNKALRQYKKCEEILKAELECVPTQPTRQLYEEIRRDRLSSSVFKHLTNL